MKILKINSERLRWFIFIKVWTSDCRASLDILYSVPAVQISGAGSVPAMGPPPPPQRALPAVQLPVWGGCGDRGPGLYTWNASCPVEAPPLFCVLEKLCTDPQVKVEEPLASGETEHTNTQTLPRLAKLFTSPHQLSPQVGTPSMHCSCFHALLFRFLLPLGPNLCGNNNFF